MTIDDLALAISKEFQNIYKRFDAIDERFNDMERHFNARFDTFETRVHGVEKPIDALVRERLHITDKNWP